MSRKRNIFTTYGTLRVSIVEALDLVDSPAVGNNKKVKVTKSNVFAALKVTDDNGVEIKHCNTETHPFVTSEAMNIGEEFIFENISSAHNLLVSFYSVSLEKEKTHNASVTVAQNCLGFTQIPLARLEENVSIMQWHQLFSSSSSSDGLRSAVRIECNFSSENNTTSTKNATTAIRRTGSTARYGSEYNTGASRGSMYFDDYVDEMVEDDDEDESSVESDASSDGDLGSFHKKTNPERVFVRNLPSAGATGMPQKLNDSIESEEEKHEDGGDVKLQAGVIDYCIVLGPAEPFSLLKPSHAVTASGALSSLSRNVSSENSVTTTTTTFTPLPSNPYTGLFSNNAESSEEQEIIVWDRLPKEDHFDSELPSKLEWFACPEGSKTVLHHKRPDPYYQSFVLSSGGETEEVFGLSINFFIALGSFSGLDLDAMLPDTDAMKNEDAGEEDCEDPAWWRRVRSVDPNSNLDADLCSDLGFHPQRSHRTRGDSSIGDDSDITGARRSKKKLWTVVSLCVLFRASQHVQQLRKCLEHAYYESIEPNLVEWEEAWEKKVREQVSLLKGAAPSVTTAETDPSPVDHAISSLTLDGSQGKGYFGAEIAPNLTDPDQLSAVLSTTFKSSFMPFSLHIERLMAILCLECPVPIPGFLSVCIQFPKRTILHGKDASIPLLTSSNSENNRSPRRWQGESDNNSVSGILNASGRPESVEFSAPSPEDFPWCPYPLEVLLKCFGPRTLIDIVCCVLSECRILFHSSDLALLPVICEGLRSLIYPLQWTHVYLPVVPMHLLNVVEAPVPFMLGTHSKWLKYIQIEYMNDMVLIDCDTASIDMGGSLAVQFPEREDRWLMMGLRSILQPVQFSNDRHEIDRALLGQRFKKAEIEICETNTKIQLMFYDVLFHLLRYVPDCLFYLNPSCPVFNRPLFISDYASDEYRPTLELITVTNCFHVLTESIHTPSLAFFYKHIVRVSDIEKKILDQSIAAEESMRGGQSSNDLAANTSPAPNSPSVNGGRGPLRRTNSGGGGGGGGPKGFSRNVSVANIIYDKLVSVSSPPAPGNLGIQRQTGLRLNEMAGEESSSKSHDLPSPKVIQHSGRGLMRHISILGMSVESKEGTPARSFYSAGPSTSLNLNHESPNEIAYSSLLPLWLLKPSAEITSAVACKVDSVRALLDKRLAYYVPYLRDKTAPHEGKEGKGNQSPKASYESLLKLSGESQRSMFGEHTLVITCEYAADMSAFNAALALSAAPSLSQSSPQPSSQPPVQSVSLDLTAVVAMSKSRSAMPRVGSAHLTVRSGSLSGPAMTLSVKGTPRSGSKLKLKSNPQASKSAKFNGDMSLPVLTNVPSFRTPPPSPLGEPNAPQAPPTPSSSRTLTSGASTGTLTPQPQSPLARLFQNNTIHEHGEDTDEERDEGFGGFAANEAGEVIPRAAGFGGKLSSFSNSAHNEEDLVQAVESLDDLVKSGDVEDEEKLFSALEEHSSHSGNTIRPDIAEPTPPEEPLPQPLIEFDPSLVAAAQLQTKRWTVLDLAHACDVPSTVMLQTYSKMRSFASSKLCENTQFAARHRAINTGNQQNKRMLNAADTQATVDRLGKVGHHQCDECITMFLQKVVTESVLEEHWLEDSVQRCIKALQDAGNRKCLIDMLKNAKQTKDSHQVASKVYPLNSAAFEAFSKLFSGVLRICSNQEDYLCAYGLLEVGGLYFRFLQRNDDETNDTDLAQDEIMEFLSERTCQHPIYHNSSMWCDLMRSRVPVPTGTAVTVPPPSKNARPVTNMVMSEVHSLLYIMLELEVNSSRALLFIQGVASDYGLGINDYYKLQRSVNRIWANNHVDEVAAVNEAEHHVASLHKSDHHGGMIKKRSKENMRDRRASMSIGDMLLMQGHSTSKLFRQSSVDSMHGRSASVKVRTTSITTDSTGEGPNRSPLHSPRAVVRRNSLGAAAIAEQASSDEMDGNFGAPSLRRTRSKSLANKSGMKLSINTLSVDSLADTGSEKALQAPALFPAGAATPLHPRSSSLHQISEHGSPLEGIDDTILSHSKHSDNGLSLARSTHSGSNYNLTNYSDSDSTSPRGDSSHNNSPRVDRIMMHPSSAFLSGDDKGLDEMLGLQRVSSAMLMRSNSMGAKQNSASDLFEAPKNLPNQFAPLDLIGRDEAQVTSFDCVDSWLVTGASDGSINITDLTTGACTIKYRHGSGSGDKYRGITAVHCMPAPCPGGAKTSLFFTGCSNGIIKSWPIPTSATSSQTATSPSSSTQPSSYWGFRMNLRLKNSISVMKMHTAPITALISKPVDSPAGWLLASGDERGVVCLTRGNEKSSSTTCCSTTIHPGATKLGGVNSSNGAQTTTPRAQPAREVAPVSKVLTGGQPSISCLAFIGTPSTFLEPGAGNNKSKAGKKAGSGGAAVGVSGGATGGASAGSEEYLGVGTSTGLISVLDLATAHPIYQVAGHAGRVTQIIGLRSNEFISCSMDRSIKLWDIRTRNRPTQTFGGKILEERSLGASNYRKCAASPITAIAVGGGDSSLVISTSADGVVRLWDRRYDVNVPCCVTQGHTNRITAIAWNGVNEFHTASHDGTVRTWDSINGQNTFMLQAFNEEGITNMKMTSFKCAQHIMITPRGPVTFTDPDKLGNRTCIVTSGWNGTIKSFVHDV